MEGINTEAMSKQAQQIWAMLDDMSENSPAAYKNFIERQLREAKEHVVPPEPHMCVHVTLLGKSRQPLFVNFFSWIRISEPKSSEDPVPVTGTPITPDKDDKGKFSVTCVAFNPRVLEKFGRNATNTVDCDTLIQLALDYVEQEQKVKVTRTYTILPIDTPHKGDIHYLRQSFSKLFKKEEHRFDKHVNELESTFGPLTSQEKGSLLSQLSRIAVDSSESSSDADTHTSREEIPEIKLTTSSGSANKKGLIEVLDDGNVKTPKYSLETCNSGPRRDLVLKVDLQGVESVSECQLDISEDDVCLQVPGQYDLKVKLPSPIDVDVAHARFNKKLSTLTVTLSPKV
ncbi:unnamed protein product [Candidula unifasciata]|uniref:PIH1 domain-containing protein 2 n=1 Tax=Candidula unifasciata TaxID=100452 RepID=A0A8S3Z3L2_9EUPU|nr:unnamed protein product [Candidula unifasciata]